MTRAPPKVFISYSHDTIEHQERVLGFADRLRADGIDAEIDQYNTAPPESWPLWCERQIAAADVVLMVCTETYYRRVSGDEERGKGLGAVWEARIIRQLLYDTGAISDKFVPVLFSEASPEQIPTPIKGWTRYVVDTENGYEELYRRLTGQPRLLRPALGKIRPMPTRRRQWPESTMETASSPEAGLREARGSAEAEPKSALRGLLRGLSFGRESGILKKLGSIVGILLIVAIMLWGQYGLDQLTPTMPPPADFLPWLNKIGTPLIWVFGHPDESIPLIAIVVVLGGAAWLFFSFWAGAAAIFIAVLIVYLHFERHPQLGDVAPSGIQAPKVLPPTVATKQALPPAQQPAKKQAGPFDGEWCWDGNQSFRRYCFRITGNTGTAVVSNGNYRIDQPMIWIDQIYSDGFCGRQLDTNGNSFPVCATRVEGNVLTMNDRRGWFPSWDMKKQP